MLFMKGTPTAPVCGFSLRVVNILKHLGNFCNSSWFNRLWFCKCKYSYKSFCSREFESIFVRFLRFSLLCSDWPTFPQLFIGGEFVGGCDIVTDLYKSGELKKMLADVGALVRPETPTTSTDAAPKEEKK